MESKHLLRHIILKNFKKNSSHEYDIFQKVVKVDYSIRDDFDVNAKDLIEKLLKKDPNERLGASEIHGYCVLKDHKFFKAINWTNLLESQIPK